ncbi:MAG: hypothetical protein ABEJ66_02590, partial [Candidatus Nanohaloarchaea archaeon]
MRKVLMAAALLLLLGTVSAFDADYRTVDRVASPEDPAVFELEVRNTGSEEKIFSVSVRPYSYWFYTDSGVTVEPGENHTFRLLVTPPGNAVQQNYRFDATVSAGGETRRFTEFFTVEHENDLVIRSLTIGRDSYRPGETLRVRVGILNTAPSRVENYSVRMALGNSTAAKEGLPLSPGSSGRLAMNLRVPDMSPGRKKVQVEILRNGEVMQSVTQKVEIEAVTRIERETDADNRLLFYTWSGSVTNEGNHPVNITIDTTLADYLRPITSFSPDPERKRSSNNLHTYVWSYRLEPGETVKVSYQTDYWIPAAILVALLAGLVALKKVRTRISFTKTAQATDEGVKVQIELENRSGTPVRDVTVKDFVPDIASVVDDFPMASPVRRKTSNGTRLSWEIDELEPGSQRVFEYSIRPRFEVEGGVTLPAAE